MTSEVVLPDFGGQQPCLQVDPELFFPDSPGIEPQRAKELQPLCGSCPVASSCLEFALTNSVTGVWAGTSTSERRQMRRAANIQANGQQRRATSNRAAVEDLTRKGLSSGQIIAQTGLHEQFVYRVRRDALAAQEQVA
ncbi:WhiB family transcriptional regulator [Janibacter sp. GS2]|uniref:WhiB family transcriptional regulator n=1 Tax=Janibacter sp. GS2 TaxID=3442646 RepID=UPI003EBA0FE3